MNAIPEYYADWSPYAFDTECEQRFLSLEHQDLMKICDVIEVDKQDHPRLNGCVPVHYENGRLYVLKEGHTRVAGDTGSKKSRTVIRGSIVTSALSDASVIVADPKGELYEDSKLRHLLNTRGYRLCCLDFRRFDRDALNIIGPAFDLMRQGKVQESDAFIDRFLSMLTETEKAKNIDPFWDSQASLLIGSIIRILRDALIQQDDRDRFHLASVLTFIRQDKESLERIFSRIVRQSAAVRNPVRIYQDMVGASAERTFSSIISTAQSLLAPFTSSDGLLRMLSCDTFDMTSLYREKAAVFIITPDESKGFAKVSGYIMNLFYELLLMEYAQRYQGRKQPRNINFLVDEAASVLLPDIASKISAGRSRCINFTVVYQAEKQMALAYKDYGTIVGNCKNFIFLGSTDYENLREVSESLGRNPLSPEGGTAPLVSVEDLRRMRKEIRWKEGLVCVGNYVLAARLPDYDVYGFLKKEPRHRMREESRIPQSILVYTPEEVAADYGTGKIRMAGGRPVRKPQSPGKNTGASDVDLLMQEFDKIFEEDDSEDCCEEE